ncbi:MAG: oxidoreductase, partial [Micrococcales bacterium]
EGPYGVFTEDRRSKPKVTLIAAGIGVPPIRALAESMAAKAGDIQVVYRTRNEEDAALLDELRTVCDYRGFELHVLAGSRGSASSWMPAGDARPDHERLLAMVPDVAESDVFICGPVAWTRAVEKSLRRAGTPATNIHAEEFAW